MQVDRCHFLLKCLYQGRKVSDHVFVLRVSIVPLSTVLIFDFRTILTVWYFLFFIILMQKHDSEHSCICDGGINFASISSMIFLLNFGIVLTM